MLLACSRHSDCGEHTILHFPNTWSRLKCCFIAYWLEGGGGGGGGMECPILFSAPQFLFRSAFTGVAIIIIKDCWHE